MAATAITNGNRTATSSSVVKGYDEQMPRSGRGSHGPDRVKFRSDLARHATQDLVTCSTIAIPVLDDALNGAANRTDDGQPSLLSYDEWDGVASDNQSASSGGTDDADLQSSWPVNNAPHELEFADMMATAPIKLFKHIMACLRSPPTRPAGTAVHCCPVQLCLRLRRPKRWSARASAACARCATESAASTSS
ncbi:hypothetical protein BCR44DRAFT_59784 [Catenaria anguillulae PL171]|uniref:Uncharacterized protein n=1 Tax=Catenaria anguillulae PL171 TaxID=765915 RepID=A0A1Y2HQH6_9FUNG|nr:hypothetical protein BCR44DRAFT_59784 [Catenaria anguillulae PL171]